MLQELQCRCTRVAGATRCRDDTARNAPPRTVLALPQKSRESCKQTVVEWSGYVFSTQQLGPSLWSGRRRRLQRMALPVTECNSCRVYAHCVEPHAGQRLLPLESRKFKQGPPRHSGIQEKHHFVPTGCRGFEKPPAFLLQLELKRRRQCARTRKRCRR